MLYHYHYTGWPWQTIGGARTIWPDNSETDRVHGSSHKGKQGSDENIKRSRGCYFTNRLCLLMWPEAIFAKNETKGGICIKIEFNPQKNISLLQHGRRFFSYSSNIGRRDVMWTHTIVIFKLQYCLWSFHKDCIYLYGR